MGTLATAALLLAVAVSSVSCSGSPRASPVDGRTPSGSSTSTPTPPSSTPPSRPPAPSPPASTGAAARAFTVSDGLPRRATLSIPALGLRDLPVVPYRGWTDDAPGTRIQDGGVAASPHGPRGGVGPGGIGNYQVTAHRTSSTAAFRRLPSLEVGDQAIVVAGGVRYVYEIRATRSTSFRSFRSLAEQRAAVPGRPGARPTQVFLTLSTCATPEDHAAGNYWSDEFKNPEHRIDKIGVLVRSAPVRGAS